MDNFGALLESDGRYALQFERFYSQNCEEVFRVLTNPSRFSEWYPFATGEMDLRTGGKIAFDDGEGATYEAVITKLDQPSTFSFREVDDLIDISLQEEENGCRMTFTHTFNDKSWAVNTAAGWHNCLDAFGQIINGQTVVWNEDSADLRKIYSEKFGLIS